MKKVYKIEFYKDSNEEDLMGSVYYYAKDAKDAMSKGGKDYKNYNSVNVVEVPESEVKEWGEEIFENGDISVKHSFRSILNESISSKEKGTVIVANHVQKVLLDEELLGQFSDGFWENSRNESWKYIDKVEIGSKTGVKFDISYIPYYYKGYSVNNKELLSYVGDRMLAMAKIANYFKTDDISDISTFLEYKLAQKIQNNETITPEFVEKSLEEFELQGDYWAKKAKSARKFIKKVGMDAFISAVNSKYTMANMRKELAAITKILKNVITK